MAASEKLFAQFTLMNYLQGSRGDRTVQEILKHVHDNTSWGRSQLGKEGPPDRGLRNVQNWLKDIRESAEFGQQIEYHEDPSNRKQYRYKSRLPVVGHRIMPVEEACTLLMAEKFLDAALPADFFDASLQDLFRSARDVLAAYDQRPKHARRQIKGYLKRVAVEQRGQALVVHAVPYEVLGILSRAILDGKCVQLRYRGGDERTLHPYAIVLKSPKIYLLAVDDRDIAQRRPLDLRPRQFLCARISDAKISERANRVPDEFDADKFVKQGGLDVALPEESGLPTQGFTLKLRIYAASDNLLQDLQEFPLTDKQRLAKESGTSNYILSAPGMRATHQLTEWIVGRLNRVEVLAPLRLRAYIAARIEAVHRLYAGDR